MSVLSFADLPDEILCRIMRSLDLWDILNIRAINRQWNRVSQDDALWRHLFCRYYEDNAEASTIKTGDWRKSFLNNIATRELYIKSLTGKIVTITIADCKTVLEVAQKYMDKEGHPLKDICFIRKCRRVLLSRSLREANLLPGSRLDMVLRHKGIGHLSSISAPQAMYPPLPICEVNPEPSSQQASIRCIVGVRFFEPVKLNLNVSLSSVIEVFLQQEPGRPIPGQLAFCQTSLIFMPDKPLAFDSCYDVVVHSQHFSSESQV
eukprot:TRINITY_DN3021_c0_g1_i6.p1 TRINITY_DN3021_c0_g1~~TRINITY_DN3021_c0_g1_i6.p1  ORF type:complete len:263 (-),score=29.21 TRINITY_DN3021_c0_g1_i6:343-1131(-)